jgi:hypothetical protein
MKPPLKTFLLLTGVFSFFLLNCRSQVVTIGQEAILYKSYIPYYVKNAHRPENALPNIITVDFQYHPGKAILKDGKKINGWFCFGGFERKPSVKFGMKLKESTRVFYKKDTNVSQPEILDEDDFLRLSLAGKDEQVFTSVDSTLFLKKDGKLLRLKADKPFPFYDNLRIVDELKNHNFFFWNQLENITGSAAGSQKVTVMYLKAQPLMDWVDAAAYRQLRYTDMIYFERYGEIKRIKKWDDISGVFQIDPYIRDIGKLSYKDGPYDIDFAITFSLSRDKLAMVPFFDNIEINLKDGRQLKGTGLVIPFDMILPPGTGSVTFFDGNKFLLLAPEQIRSVNFRNKVYQPVFNRFYKTWFMAYPWKFEGNQYFVAESDAYPRHETGYFHEEGRPAFQVLREKNNGNFVFDNADKLTEQLLKEVR